MACMDLTSLMHGTQSLNTALGSEVGGKQDVASDELLLVLSYVHSMQQEGVVANSGSHAFIGATFVLRPVSEHHGMHGLDQLDAWYPVIEYCTWPRARRQARCASDKLLLVMSYVHSIPQEGVVAVANNG